MADAFGDDDPDLAEDRSGWLHERFELPEVGPLYSWDRAKLGHDTGCSASHRPRDQGFLVICGPSRDAIMKCKEKAFDLIAFNITMKNEKKEGGATNTKAAAQVNKARPQNADN